MRIDFVTLFPEMVLAGVRHSILGRAEERGLVRFGTANPRDYTYDRHGKVDDTPFGGEPGMLIKAEPVALAVEGLRRTGGSEDGRDGGVAVVLTDPAAPLFTQADARGLSSFDHLIFLCGHYEGFDHRVKTQIATHAFSIGDYVLTNGELPALVMADAIVRLIPEVLGSAESLAADSYSDGLLSAPNYTRPEVWRGEEVPEVLRSGNHQAIQQWRRSQALKATQEMRPDLFAKAKLNKADIKLISGD
ncbi:MAG: tRNA (guanosine(37)-N1)-methyltransferase TrmD [Fimbriimonas sp.]